MKDFAPSLLPIDLLEIANTLSDSDREKLSGKTVLITGATGFIGKALTATFSYLVNMFEVDIQLVLAVRDREKAENLRKAIGCVDISSIVDWGELRDGRYRGGHDLCVHTASATGPREFGGSRIEFAEDNLFGTMSLMAASQPGTTFVQLSTAEIYGVSPEGKSFLAKESDFQGLDPWVGRLAYPIGKLTAEMLGAAHSESRGVRFSSIRLDHVFGPGMNLQDGRVLGDFFRDSVFEEKIVVRSSGEGQLRLTYISDVISGVLRVVLGGDDGPYNLCGAPSSISLSTLARKLVDINSSGARTVQVLGEPINTSEYLRGSPPGLNSQRLLQLGWTPSVGLDEGIERTILSIAQRSIGGEGAILRKPQN